MLIGVKMTVFKGMLAAKVQEEKSEDDFMPKIRYIKIKQNNLFKIYLLM